MHTLGYPTTARGGPRTGLEQKPATLVMRHWMGCPSTLCTAAPGVESSWQLRTLPTRLLQSHTAPQWRRVGHTFGKKAYPAYLLTSSTQSTSDHQAANSAKFRETCKFFIPPIFLGPHFVWQVPTRTLEPLKTACHELVLWLDSEFEFEFEFESWSLTAADVDDGWDVV